jgi:hypothetical protein
MTRVPVLTGTRVAVVDAPDDAVILRPPPPAEAIDDVGAAVRDALRFPLAGEPLEALVPRGGRVTIVVEPPALPIPGAPHDPRQAALVAAVAELERLGVPHERQTILLAGGLTRRAGTRELMLLFPPDAARRFRGRIEVHDAERDDLVDVGAAGRTPLRVNPLLVETDVVVVVTAAETVLHGGPAALVGAAGAEAARAAGAYSLLETGASLGWRVAVALERALAGRVRLAAVSLTLNHPGVRGALHGYPYDGAALERVTGSPLRRLFALLPGFLRARVLQSIPRELTVAAAFAGPPSVAHAEALLRGIAARQSPLDSPLDAIVIGIPRLTPYLPRERPNPLLATVMGLGLALRLWRDAFPVVDGGTAILVHRFHRHFTHPTQQPYRAFFQGARFGRDPDELAAAERRAADDSRAIAEYRAGRTCHPRLPFSDWEGCMPALGRLGALLVAGCRDSVAARQLGFVPIHGIGAALDMARGRAGDAARIGVLLSPPYFPLQVRAPEGP